MNVADWVRKKRTAVRVVNKSVTVVVPGAGGCVKPARLSEQRASAVTQKLNGGFCLVLKAEPAVFFQKEKESSSGQRRCCCLTRGYCSSSRRHWRKHAGRKRLIQQQETRSDVHYFSCDQDLDWTRPLISCQAVPTCSNRTDRWSEHWSQVDVAPHAPSQTKPPPTCCSQQDDEPWRSREPDTGLDYLSDVHLACELHRFWSEGGSVRINSFWLMKLNMSQQELTRLSSCSPASDWSTSVHAHSAQSWNMFTLFHDISDWPCSLFWSYRRFKCFCDQSAGGVRDQTSVCWLTRPRHLLPVRSLVCKPSSWNVTTRCLVFCRSGSWAPPDPCVQRITHVGSVWDRQNLEVQLKCSSDHSWTFLQCHVGSESTWIAGLSGFPAECFPKVWPSTHHAPLL